MIGTPVDGRRVRLEDPVDGGPAATGEPGELVVLGTPGVDRFVGCLDDPAPTAKVFAESPEGTWFHTGDLVRADERGRMQVVGLDELPRTSVGKIRRFPIPRR